MSKDAPPTPLASNSQLEALVVLGCPAVVFGFGGELAFLVTELRSNNVDLDEGAEDARSLPLEVVGSHHCWRVVGKSGEVPQCDRTILCFPGGRNRLHVPASLCQEGSQAKAESYKVLGHG